jgi:hypothetical protein
MDIISQLQEQLNEVAMLAVNTFGTLQRDAPPVRLSNSYPDPLNPNPNPDDPASQPAALGQPKDQAQAQAEPKPPAARPHRATQGHEPRPRSRRQEGNAPPVITRPGHVFNGMPALCFL